MTAAVLLVTHEGIGSAMIKVARKITGSTLDNMDFIDIEFDPDISMLEKQLNDRLSHIDCGEGVLVLTDLIGATPCNLASNVLHSDCLFVTGLNLPMLIRVYNYREKPLSELADIACQGAVNGILQLTRDNCINMKEL